MRQRYLVDSSIWVANFRQSERSHENAAQIIQKIMTDQQEIILPEIVFVETLNVLKRTFKMSADGLGKVKNYFFNTTNIQHCTFTKNFLKNNIINVIMQANLRSSDMQILAHAVENNCILLTFDKKLDEQYNNLISHEE